MRWAVAFVCLGVAGCALSDPPLVTPDPPTPSSIATWVTIVNKEIKLPTPLEISPARNAHPLAPGDWIVCLKSGAPDQRVRYAMFFKKDFVTYRIAIGVDACYAETYAAVP